MPLRAAALTAALFAAPAVAQESEFHYPPAPVVIEKTAHALFDELPRVEPGGGPEGECGADEQVNPVVAYCTSQNVIFMRLDSFYDPQEGYELAHVFGHAVQVRHGVADVALAAIRARPEEETKLRGWVTRQAECIAGFIYTKAGLEDVSLFDLFEEEPFTDRHWGRHPLSVAPKVSIGLEARDEWFKRGLKGDLTGCAVGEFGSELLLAAVKS